MKKVILHVGLHKTGTTTIQNFLFKEKDKLLENKILYPEVSGRGANHSTVFYSIYSENPESYHINIRQGLTSKAQVDTINEKMKKELSCMSNLDFETIIISGEDISYLSEASISALKSDMLSWFGNDLEFEVVICLRSPLSYWNSVVQQLVKDGQSISEVLIKLEANFANIYKGSIEKFINIFQKDSIKTYDFSKSLQHKNGVLGTFLELVGIESIFKSINNTSDNEGLCYEAIHLMSYINQKKPLIINNEVSKERSLGDLNPLKLLTGKKFNLSSAQQKYICKKAEKDVDWLSQNFGIVYKSEKVLDTDLDVWGDSFLNSISLVYDDLRSDYQQLVVDFIRDISLIDFEKNHPVKALKLLEFCLNKRPGGPLIQRKVRELKARCLVERYILEPHEVNDKDIASLLNNIGIEDPIKIIEFAREVRASFPTLSFQMILFARKINPKINAVWAELLQEAKKLNGRFLVDPEKRVVFEIFRSTKRFAPEFSSLIENYMSLDFFNTKGESLFNCESTLITNIYDSIVQNGYFKFINPYTGGTVYSTTYIDGVGYEFMESGGNTFYIGFDLEHFQHHPLEYMYIIFPAKNEIYVYGEGADKIAFPSAPLNISLFLYRKARKIPSPNSLITSSAEKPESKKVVITTKGLFHIGHCLWNELSVFGSLIDLDKLNLNTNVEIALLDNFYMSSVEYARYLSLEKTKNLSYFNDVIDYTNKKNYLPLIFSHSYISGQLSNDLSQYLIKSCSSEFPRNIKGKHLVLLSVRAGERSCVNEVEIYTRLIKSFNNEDITFVIDGVNYSDRLESTNAGAIARLKPTIECEKNIAGKILRNVKAESNVFSIVGEDICNSIYWANKAACVISPWGAGLVKYRWILDKPSFVYGSSATMSQGHKHKFLYDNHKYKENNTNSCYYDYATAFDTEATRNSDYKLDVEAFCSQVKQFILKELGDL